MADFTTIEITRRWFQRVSTDEVREDIIIDANAYASAFVRAKLGKTATTAIEAIGTTSNTPDIVKFITTKYAVYEASMMQLGASSQGIPDFVLEWKEQAVTALDEIKTGKMTINEIANKITLNSNTKNFHTTVNEDDPIEWVTDPDKLDEIEADRDK